MLKAQSLSGCQARFFCPQDAGLWASGGLFTRVGHQPYSAFQPPTLDTLLIFTGMSIPNLFKKNQPVGESPTASSTALLVLLFTAARAPVVRHLYSARRVEWHDRRIYVRDTSATSTPALVPTL
jgi:hypothetical protein